MDIQPIEPSHVVELVQAIFDNMLQMPCEPNDSSPQSEASFTEDRLVGCVQIQGDWVGAVEIHTPLELGRKAASAMLMVPDEDVSMEDVQDTIAELSNMVGGSIKAILPGQSTLSLPSVASGAGLDFKLANVVHTQSVGLRSNDTDFSIAIRHQEPQPQ
ncbi:chemotaxis protein CheX [Rhodopirellula sallentina]|uniref:Inhibitor of MCP methylation CheC-like protein n=1 Tax=Rhodopirellula sallentina SM41 TaxID=1263870 RepID=M5U5R3_9BACT|nr:chemotaxis protein CheX [Rhodopirellula sallentina]EMI56785.1 inhibitor of MCP methylation CheC-like protein [Rhodopirellula sallentina SM41]